MSVCACACACEQIHRAKATIIEPTGESDNPLRFTSGLVVALDIDATLEHIHDPHSSVKVQVGVLEPPAVHPVSEGVQMQLVFKTFEFNTEFHMKGLHSNFLEVVKHLRDVSAGSLPRRPESRDPP